MGDRIANSPQVENSIAKANGELAIGADLPFQKTWWRVERTLWGIFAVIVVAAVTGLLGRGDFAHAIYQSPDNALTFAYERIQRIDTPSTLTVHIAPQAVQAGHVTLWVGADTLRNFGLLRTAPIATEEIVQSDGELLVYPALPEPLNVHLFLRSTLVGFHRIDLQTHGSPQASVEALILP